MLKLRKCLKSKAVTKLGHLLLGLFWVIMPAGPWEETENSYMRITPKFCQTWALWLAPSDLLCCLLSGWHKVTHHHLSLRFCVSHFCVHLLMCLETVFSRLKNWVCLIFDYLLMLNNKYLISVLTDYCIT